jgi:hypothetical protein
VYKPTNIKEVIIKSVAAEAVPVDINYRKFYIANTGAQPLYFDIKTATAETGMLVPANTVFPEMLTCEDLSLISNVTGTTASILIIE